ncbi:hypothetical protein [Hymenobacter arizonensis]|uniref:hypothetical protein n=1 Tax=Hymenobacter arizonensis TaxID=1227077 RepID=UPI0015A5E7BF|nr:hypothetical protein [Hymenobacter arizonensis]
MAGGGRLLARAQAWGTPVLLPGLWCWYAWRTADVVYWDAHVSLELTESTGWRSGVTSQSVTLYRARGVLFEQLLGDVHVTQAAPVYPDHPDQVLYHKDWWPVVRAVTVDEKSRTGVLRLSAGSIPFRVTE